MYLDNDGKPANLLIKLDPHCKTKLNISRSWLFDRLYISGGHKPGVMGPILLFLIAEAFFHNTYQAEKYYSEEPGY